MVHRVHPEIIINCVGILIKGSREHPDNAILINAYFPHLLKRLSDEVGAKLIHISTDCVFSGKKGNYTEDDFRDADDVYGRSKALGEIINDKDLTIRTSIIGPELKENLLNLFKEIWGKDTVIKPYDGNEVDKSIEKSLRLDYEVPSYRQMLVEQFEMMKSYSNLYSAY